MAQTRDDVDQAIDDAKAMVAALSAPDSALRTAGLTFGYGLSRELLIKLVTVLDPDYVPPQKELDVAD